MDSTSKAQAQGKKKRRQTVFQFTVLHLKGHYQEDEKVANKQEKREEI